MSGFGAYQNQSGVQAFITGELCHRIYRAINLPRRKPREDDGVLSILLFPRGHNRIFLKRPPAESQNRASGGLPWTTIE
jgi:hypothetical protein